MITGTKILHQAFGVIQAYSEDRHAVFKAPDVDVALSFLNEMLQAWAFHEIVDISVIENADDELEVFSFRNAIIYNLAWIIAMYWGHVVRGELELHAKGSLEYARRAPPVIISRGPEMPPPGIRST